MPEQSDISVDRWGRYLVVLSLVAALVAVGVLASGLWVVPPVWAWLIFAVILVALLAGLGRATNGKWLGALIDSRNRMSLSRLQIALWTVMILSSYMAIALPRASSDALIAPTAEDADRCRAAHIRDVQGIRDLAALGSQERQAAEQRAAEECVPQPLQIAFPPEVIVAMGISVTSFAASSLVKGAKQGRKVYALRTDLQRELREAEGRLDQARERRDTLNAHLGAALTELESIESQSGTEGLSEEVKLKKGEIEGQIALLKIQIPEASKTFEAARSKWQEVKAACDEENESAAGLLYKNKDPAQAALSDLFRGDEVGNYQRIDLSKVQMFFFTLVVLASYGAALLGLLRESSLVLNPLGVTLPAFSSSMNTLFGISHAGYVSVKAVDHTQTG